MSDKMPPAWVNLAALGAVRLQKMIALARERNGVKEPKEPRRG